ncbi:MAG: hypothetical protein II309_05020 [Bacilli bacterium]|nr:hypothetical protein [Bacilli bacterium]
MNKIYLIIYNKPMRFQFIKYFDNIKEKNKYKNKIRFVKDLFIVEDSCDTVYY